MGYTHYWMQSGTFTKKEWASIKIDVAYILIESIKNHGVVIAGGDGKDCPLAEMLNDRFICFNGREDLGEWAETFEIKRVKGKDSTASGIPGVYSSWCKTAREPYDLAVAAILIYLETVRPGKFLADSDGTTDDLAPALQVVRTAIPRLSNIADFPAAVLLKEEKPDKPNALDTIDDDLRQIAEQWGCA